MKRLLTILLALALIGGGGYFGWNYYQDSKTNTDPSEGGKYLVIKEWGVRFRLPPESPEDLYYFERKGTDYETFGFESKSLDLENCAPISVTRTDKSNLGNKQIDQKHYGFLRGAQACDISASPHQIKANALQDKLYDALSSLEKSP